MDPISLTGLTTGLVSLGLQVTGGIITYVDGLKNQSKELESVRRLNEALGTTIDVAQSVFNRIPPQNQQLQAAGRQCIDHCKVELNTLDTLVAGLAGMTTSTWRAKLKQKTKQLRFPFDREKIQQLADRIGRTNSALSLALQASGLDIAVDHAQKLFDIQISSTALVDELHHTRDDIQAVQTSVVDVQTTIVDGVKDINQTITTCTEAIQQNMRQTETIALSRHRETMESHRELSKMISLLTDQLNRDQRIAGQNVVFSLQNANTLALVTEPADLTRGRRSVEATIVSPDLISSPSISTDESETTATRSQLAVPVFRLQCTCRRLKRNATHRIFRVGYLTVYHEARSVEHWPACPLARPAKMTGPKSSPFSAMIIPGFLRTAIGMCLGLGSHSGGTMASQRIDYFPTVDEGVCPAFRVLDTIAVLLGRSFQMNPSQDEPRVVDAISIGLLYLNQLFLERRSSPKAVTTENSSLLQFLVTNLSYFTYYDMIVPLVKLLTEVGVSVENCDIYGFDVLGEIARPSCKPIHPVLLAAAPDIIANQQPVLDITTDTILTMQQSERLAEAYGCGPLSLAILRGDAKQVRQLATEVPSTRHGINAFGHTPFHLAVRPASAACLRVLLDLPEFTSLLLDKADSDRQTPLEVALQFSRITCKSIGFSECSQRNCADTVVMLCEAGCSLVISPRFYQSACERAARQYFRYLRDDRLALARDVLTYMPSLKRLIPGLSDKAPLDMHLSKVQDLLEKDGVGLGRHVSNYLYNYPGIYAHISSVEHAKYLLGLGFCDTEAAWCYHMLYLPADYLLWLTNQNDSLLWPWPDNTATKPQGCYISRAHKIAFVAAFDAMSYNHDLQPEVISAIQSADVLDECRCRCSPAGCSTNTYLYKGMTDALEIYGRGKTSKLKNVCLAFPHRSMIRLRAFDCLSLTHTCCKVVRHLWNASGVKKGLSPEETAEIQQEEAHELEVLERLVKELSQAFPDESDLAAQDTFWGEYWEETVQRALDDLDGDDLPEEERQQAEEIGVRWCERAEQPLRAEGELSEFEVLPPDPIERYYRQLHEIAPDLAYLRQRGTA